MKRTTRALTYVTVVLIGVGACGKGGDDNGAVDAAEPKDGVPPNTVQFLRDVVPIFNKSCGSGTEGCHHRKTYGANASMDCRGWLSLENAPLGSIFYGGAMMGQPTGCPDMPLHGRLMNIAVWQCRTGPLRSYAKAGDLAGSYIINKLRGVDMCNADGSTMVSDKMPTPTSNFVISEGDIETIEAWVKAGAKND